MVPRILFALLVVLGFGAFAGPAWAHVHGTGHGAATIESMVAAASATPVGAVITVMTSASAALADDVCDRDCGHTPAMGGCLCMAACAAVALPDLPSLVPHPVRAARNAGDAPHWRASTRGPPTPPPRPL